MKHATLSIRQPFAQLVVNGAKRYECRTWSTPYRGRLWIHASSKRPGRDIADLVDGDEYLTAGCFHSGWFTAQHLKTLARSAIIGSVELVDVLPSREIVHRLSVFDQAMCGSIGGNDFLWELADPQLIDPVSDVDGKLNLWPLPTNVAERVQAAAHLLPAGPRAWSFEDIQDDWFAGFWRRRFTGAAAAIPGTDTESPREFWRALGAWLEGLGARSAKDEVTDADSVVRALIPHGRRTRQRVVEEALQLIESELDADLAERTVTAIAR